jgi:hypothetical protein
MPRSLIETGVSKPVAFVNTVKVENSTSVANMTERVVFHNTRPNGEIEIDISRGTIHYFTQNATGNFQFNFRTSSTRFTGDVASVGQSVTVAVLITNGATAFYPTNFLIDGESAAANIIWNGANGSPSEGTANTVDTFVFTFLPAPDGLRIFGNAKSTGGAAGGGLTGQGGTLTSSGGFNTHTFTTVGNSTFEIVGS